MARMKTAEALLKLPELLLRGRISFTFDGVPLRTEQLSFRQRMNLFSTGIDMRLRSDRAHGLPPTIQIEPTNVCNLKCPLCPTGTGSMKRPKGFMSFETFQRILDELGDVLICVYLYGWGEPFLNKEVPRMIQACDGRNIGTLSTTNGNCLQTLDEGLRVVDAGLTALIIALDGSTQEIYQAYRKSGDVEKVKRCAALIEEAKARRGSALPYTNLRAVVTRNNQEDLPHIERLARNLGINMFSYKTLGVETHSGKFKNYEPKEKSMRRFEYQGSSRRRRPAFQCIYPFRQPTIFWDGSLVGCEYDYDLQAPWGKIGEQNFVRLWNSPQAIELRRAIRKGLPRSEFCRRCPYQDSVRDRPVLSCKELRPVGGADGV